MNSLYERALGSQWQLLPAPVRELHARPGHHAGFARVENGGNWLARLLRWLFGFPDAAESVPVQVTLEEHGAGEQWRRSFGEQAFRSQLALGGPPGAGLIYERFGPFRFHVQIPVTTQGLRMEVRGAQFLGFPWPGFLTPRTDTREFVDDEERFRFDVAVTVPLAGLLFRYSGWLQRAD